MDPRLIDLSGLNRRPGASWRQRGWWGRTPMWERVRDVAVKQPAKSAVIEGEKNLSYGALWQEALLQAHAMRRAGVERGDIILVQLPNWHEFVIIAVAAEIAGIVFAFCPVQWGSRETQLALRLTRPRIWFTTRHPHPGEDRTALISELRMALAAGAPRTVLVRSPEANTAGAFERWACNLDIDQEEAVGGRNSEPLEIAVTSGSTGDPKGVLHVHDSAIATVDSTITRQRIGPSDVVHLAVPIGHTFGYFYGVRCALQARACLLLQSRWDALGMIDLAAKHRFTVSLGPSAFIIDLLDLAGRTEITALSSIRLFTLAGDSLPSPVVRKAIETLPFRISRALGMTEFGHACSSDAQTPLEAVIETLGAPQPEMTFRVRDENGCDVPAGTEGTIVTSGPFLFAGYLNEDRLNQEVLDETGFFDTGDLGSIDASGYLRITGRTKNVVRRGAETIPVSLLEDIIASHPAVVNAVVVGAPHERLGELPVACVQLKPDHQLALADICRLFEREKVTRRFWPIELRVFERWPIGATGKIDRRKIIAELAKRSQT